MKILVLSYEAWNDITNGNNVTQTGLREWTPNLQIFMQARGNLIINAARNTTRSLTV